jgi:ankyrin repeat protein
MEGAAAWDATFGDDFDYVRSATNPSVASADRIPWSVLQWGQNDQWDKVFTALRLGSCSVDAVVNRWYNNATLFHEAAYQGRVDVMQVLCDEHCANSRAMDWYRNTVLMYAVFAQQREAVRWLLSRPETPLSAKRRDGRTALDMARRKLDGDIARWIEEEMRARDRWSPLRAAWVAATSRPLSPGFCPFAFLCSRRTSGPPL